MSNYISFFSVLKTSVVSSQPVVSLNMYVLFNVGAEAALVGGFRNF